MSSWIYHEDDVIGDRPADLAGAALKQIAGDRDRESLPRPKLEVLLRAIGSALKEEASSYVSDPPAALRELLADDRAERRQQSRAAELQAEDKVDDGVRDILPPIRVALGAIAREYEERWKRKPRLSELLETFSFVLGYRPEDFLEDGAQHSVREIRAVVSE